MKSEEIVSIKNNKILRDNLTVNFAGSNIIHFKLEKFFSPPIDSFLVSFIVNISILYYKY